MWIERKLSKEDREKIKENKQKEKEINEYTFGAMERMKKRK